MKEIQIITQPLSRRQFITTIAVGAFSIAATAVNAKRLEKVNIPSGSLAEHPAAKKEGIPPSFILSF